MPRACLLISHRKGRLLVHRSTLRSYLKISTSLNAGSYHVLIVEMGIFLGEHRHQNRFGVLSSEPSVSNSTKTHQACPRSLHRNTNTSNRACEIGPFLVRDSAKTHQACPREPHRNTDTSGVFAKSVHFLWMTAPRHIPCPRALHRNTNTSNRVREISPFLCQTTPSMRALQRNTNTQSVSAKQNLNLGTQKASSWTDLAGQALSEMLS